MALVRELEKISREVEAINAQAACAKDSAKRIWPGVWNQDGGPLLVSI